MDAKATSSHEMLLSWAGHLEAYARIASIAALATQPLGAKICADLKKLPHGETHLSLSRQDGKSSPKRLSMLVSSSAPIPRKLLKGNGDNIARRS